MYIKNKANLLAEEILSLLQLNHEKILRSKTKRLEQFIINMIGWMVLLGTFPMIGFFIIITENDIAGFLWPILVFVLVQVIRLGYLYHKAKLKKELDILINTHKNTIKEIEKVNTFDEILQKIENLYLIIIQAKDKKESNKNKRMNSGLKEIYKKEIEFCSLILTDLRSDLQIRLDEQTKSLKSAKSEVSENIKGTTGLSQVSELQRIRLDKQIEQFEELQRVLMKI